MNLEGNARTAIFFDMDDTLYDQLAPFRLAVEQFDKEKGTENRSYDVADLFKRVRAYSDELWDDCISGRMSIAEMRIARVCRAFAELDIHMEADEAVRVQHYYELEQGRITLPEGFADYINKLGEAGIVTGLITNGPTRHQTFKLRTLGIDKLFPAERIIISDAVGFTKPDPRIFQYVNERTSTLPANSYYVGDSWRNDVAGADAAGWGMIWLNRRRVPNGEQYKPYRIIEQIEELYDFIPGAY